ncbi:CoA-transferase family III domain-containing protein [Mycena sp. CBHHK59/15]|nr:CoA-transferase family III domain-containing protein [Mycena sp. CBHHK59/15]
MLRVTANSTRTSARLRPRLAHVRHGHQTRATPTAAGGMPPPLAGIRILDLTRVLAGPTATMLLADLGADVVKVEEVARGDDTPAAHLPPESAYFLAVNRNKRSMTVNFKTPAGLEIVCKLVARADVLVENFVSGKLATMGLGWEDCKQINPRLVYASITGYGQTGPYCTAAGYDVIIEGEAGLMHMYVPDRPPCKVGVAATDIATGLYAHGAIMAALISRQQTGQGVWIDCNLFETQIAGLANIGSNYLIAGQEAGRHGTAHPSIAPYQVFPCKDGFVMIGAGNDKQFAKLAAVLDTPALAGDTRFATNAARVANREELVRAISDALLQRERAYWLERFTGRGAVPFGPINNIQQTFEHPQAVARQVTVDVDVPSSSGEDQARGTGRVVHGEKMKVRMAPPWLSQHTNEVLEELGYSEERIAELRRQVYASCYIWQYARSARVVIGLVPDDVITAYGQALSIQIVVQSLGVVLVSLGASLVDHPSVYTPPCPPTIQRPLEPRPPAPIVPVAAATAVPKSSSPTSATPRGTSRPPLQSTPSAEENASAAQPERETVDMDIFSQILELDEDDTHEFSKEMVTEYFSQASSTFLEMDKALTDRKLPQLSALGHFLKGSSAALGLSKVQASCEKMQNYGELRDEGAGKDLSDEQALEKIDALLRNIKVEYADAEKFLKKWYADHGDSFEVPAAPPAADKTDAKP